MPDILERDDDLLFSGIAKIYRPAPCGMMTVRANLASLNLMAAMRDMFDLAIPKPRCIVFRERSALCWMSPDELLILCRREEVAMRMNQLDGFLITESSLVIDVSDARIIYDVEGRGAREVLAKLCPVDLALGSFHIGDFRRTRLAQVPVAFWLKDADTFSLMVFRSVAGYVLEVLKMAARDGSDVGLASHGNASRHPVDEHGM